MRPKLIFFGDPHGEFQPVIRAVERYRPEAIILLGDIQARRPLCVELEPILDLTEIRFIHGNHDTDSEPYHDNLWHSDLAHRNLHGRVTTVAGYKVAGLGGVFRESIWDPSLMMLEAEFLSAEKLRRHMKPEERWRGGISLRHRSSIFPDEFMRLAKQHAQILVTHEGLGGAMHGQPALNTLARAMGASLVVHGHLHKDIDYLSEGRIPVDSPFIAYGVNKDSHMRWPPPRFASVLGPSFEQPQELS
ncbi:MAG: metallophosphoesterase [Burkholderiales bacterium]